MSTIQTMLRRVAVLAAAAALLAGCGTVITGSTDVDKAAFGDKKRFAIVTIASAKNFSGDAACSTPSRARTMSPAPTPSR